MKLTRPVLRYPGGKWRIAPWLISQFPPHKIYVEPYGGGASILLRKPRAALEVYNDLSSEVVNVFWVLRNPEAADKLKRLLFCTPFSREEYKLSRIPDQDPIEQARRTITRTFMGFGSTGVFKTNTGFRAHSYYQHRSVPLQWMDYPTQVPLFTERLRGVVIENRPALEVIEQQDSKETLFYIDPPYVKSSRYQKDIYDHEMEDEDHVELAAQLKQLKGMVIISGYETDLYSELFSGWEKISKKAWASANIAVRERLEVLWISPACSRASLPLFQNDQQGR